jgi:hypothetical protein
MTTITDKIRSLLYPDFVEHEVGDIVIYVANYGTRILSVGRIAMQNNELCVENISDPEVKNTPLHLIMNEHAILPYFKDRSMNNIFRSLPASIVFDMLNAYDTSLGLQEVREDQLDLFHSPVKEGDIVVFATDKLQYGEVDTIGMSGAQLIKTEDIFDGGNRTFAPYKYLVVLQVTDEEKEYIHQYMEEDTKRREKEQLWYNYTGVL